MEAPLDPARLAAYVPQVLGAAPRLLGDLDREEPSPSYGAFDRDHWSWKFRDFPVLMPQWGMYPLALLFRLPLPDSPYHGSERLLGWVRAALANLCARQASSGAWDHVGPATQDHGATVASLYYLAETEAALRGHLSDEERARVRAALLRGAAFAADSAEDYAFISNHQALYALGLDAAGESTGRAELRRRADGLVEEIRRRQSADGFYEEYGGFDPGYETLGIAYLARLWERRRDPALLASLRRSVAFLAHAVHEDGSVGGMVGSRHTRLYFPAGFEILASEIPEAAAVALHMRERLAAGNVVTPANVDLQNLYVVLLSHLHACAARGEPCEPSPLPCRALHGVRCFEGGLCAAGTDRYYALLALGEGGVGRVDDRRSGTLAYEEAGYVARMGGRTLTSQRAVDARRERGPGEGEVRVVARFAEVRQEPLTPWRFVALRLLNLTLFRSARFGRWFRRVLIGRMITRRVPGALELERALVFGEDRVEFRDRLRRLSDAPLEELRLTRAWTCFHMGSAGSFHASDLVETPLPDAAPLLHALRAGREGELRFSLVFRERPELRASDPGPAR